MCCSVAVDIYSIGWGVCFVIGKQINYNQRAFDFVILLKTLCRTRTFLLTLLKLNLPLMPTARHSSPNAEEKPKVASSLKSSRLSSLRPWWPLESPHWRNKVSLCSPSTRWLSQEWRVLPLSVWQDSMWPQFIATFSLATSRPSSTWMQTNLRSWGVRCPWTEGDWRVGETKDKKKASIIASLLRARYRLDNSHI